MEAVVGGGAGGTLVSAQVSSKEVVRGSDDLSIYSGRPARVRAIHKKQNKIVLIEGGRFSAWGQG